jgi:hypothetical protein
MSSPISDVAGEILPPMTWREQRAAVRMHHTDGDPAENRVRDGWTPHAGRHHYAKCGAYRPVPGNTDCPTCPRNCPECGAYYLSSP